MFAKSIILSGAIALSSAIAAYAGDVTITDAYIRAVSPNAPSAAAFMVIENTGAAADRLIDARSDAAMKVELHQHIDAGNGVMKMQHAPEGFMIPPAGTHSLARGGDHVMFMGVKSPLVPGESVSVTLVFEVAGEMQVDIPVDNDR